MFLNKCCKAIEIVIVEQIECFTEIEYCTANRRYTVTKRKTSSYDDVINCYNEN